MERFPSVRGVVELTDERKRHILILHPDVESFQKYFPATLAEPDVMRRSRFDPRVVIFYRALPQKKYLAIAVKINHRAFILTAYLTYKIQHLPL